MTIIVFLILVVLTAFLFAYLGILRSVLAFIFFAVFSFVLLLFVELLIQDSIMRWAMLLSCGIVIPFAIGIRYYFKQKMISDKLEAEQWLAGRQKVK